MISIKNLVLFLFLLASWSMLSQNVNFIECKLLDSSQKSPIAFATVQIKQQSIGIISNLDGSFRIPAHFFDSENQLVISCIGYQTKELGLNDLTLNQVNIITLKVEPIALDSVIVYSKKTKKQSARKIVKKAIKAIPINFCTSPFSQLGYYREYQQANGKYLNLSEAILEVFDKGFDEIDRLTTEVRIYERRTNNDFAIDTLARLPYDYIANNKIISNAFLENYGGNEFVIMRIHDPIRNYKIDSFDFVNKFQTDFLRNHYFSKLGSLMLDNEPLYVIEIKRNHIDYYVKGEIYISKYDYAIHKFKYALFEKLTQNKSRGSSARINQEKLIFETITEYRKSGDKMYLNYSSFQNSFKLKSFPEFAIEKISFLPDQKCIRIGLNMYPDSSSALDRKSYSIRLRNKKVKIDSISLQNKSILLFPAKDASEMLDKMTPFSNGEGNQIYISRSIKVGVNGIKSKNGHILDKNSTKTYYQFREFFAQKIEGNNSFKKEGPFMDPGEPLFGDQPEFYNRKKVEFWMNTPLKSINASE